MKQKSFQEISEVYELEIEKIVKEIKKSHAKRVLLQFPEGLKPYAQVICDEIENRLDKKINCLIWLGSCFGGCDVPLEAEKIGVDLIIQFGHSEWKF